MSHTQIPEELFELQTLEFLYFNHNLLGGQVSPAFGNLTELKFVDLSENNFVGTVPLVFSKLKKLEYLFLQSNALEVTRS